MALVSLPEALVHLRADAGDAKVPPLLAAAERFAVERLARHVYLTQGELDTARLDAPVALDTARTAYTAAMEAATVVEDEVLRATSERYAAEAYVIAAYESDRARNGIVVNDDIKAAILLKLEELYYGEDTVRAVDSLLAPHRAGMGV